jgi:glycosidase
LYEINAWVWLAELGAKTGSRIDLSSVPTTEWDAIAALGFDAVWLMGVWERSPAGIAIANQNQNLQNDFRRAVSDFRDEDNVGSPYCVHRYVVDQHLGGKKGLAAAREELAKRGLGLVLDFVPNHVAPDHPWVKQHPDYFIQGSPDDLRNDPASYVEIDGTVFACGKDPYFPAWPDVLQLNAFHSGLRQAVTDTLTDIARQCDGVRCDMAMLLLNDVFERTWGARAGQKPTTEYWGDVIPVVRKNNPNFLFIAEAYWDLEWELQQKGFDFCYDKRLYDRLEHEGAESVRLHLCAQLAYQQKLLRFLENHDEPRAAAAFSAEKERAAALVTSTLPGARMFHEGQFEGRKVRLPVFLGRRPDERVDTELVGFYHKLLTAIDSPVFREGQWSLCESTGWRDNPTCRNIVAWSWNKDGERYLIVVNLSANRAQAMVHTGWNDLHGRRILLSDHVSNENYERSGDDLQSSGLYVDLEPWGCHFLQSFVSLAVGL